MKTITNKLNAALLLSMAVAFASCTKENVKLNESKYTASANVVSETAKNKCCAGANNNYYFGLNTNSNTNQCFNNGNNKNNEHCIPKVSWMYETSKKDTTHELFWSVKKPNEEKCKTQCLQSALNIFNDEYCASKIN